MNDDRLYTQWIHHRRTTEVPDGFAQRVMQSIDLKTPDRGKKTGIGSDVMTRRLVNWAAAVSMVLLGIFRLLYVTANLLLGSSL
jgi:hypothetical protein